MLIETLAAIHINKSVNVQQPQGRWNERMKDGNKMQTVINGEFGSKANGGYDDDGRVERKGKA